jgi:hypothetical protein
MWLGHGTMKDRPSETDNTSPLSSVPADDSSRTSAAIDEDHDLSGEAAGVIRGVSRSLVRGPLIGRLPARASSSSVGKGILRRRLPARQVARVSDRVSTGLDWFTSALEANESESPKASKRQEWMLRARLFGWNLLRNTLLGMAVFESYGYVVSSLAHNENDNVSSPTELTIKEWQKVPTITVVADVDDQGDDDDDHDDDDVSILFGEPDEYSRASLPSHLLAGSVAGSIHGLAASLMEGNSTSRSTMRYLSWNTIHHSLAHSMLFGSYEGIKRGILQMTEDEERSVSRAYHVLTFSVAGGLAGQVQHLISHYVEGGLGLANETLQVDWRPALRTTPAIRPLLWAFPPSAIGFVAFEYGKRYVS